MTSPDSGELHVGLMSGTSLDGVSAAVVRFAEVGGRITAELIHGSQYSYDSRQRERLLSLMQSGSSREYCRLNADLGDWFANAALSAMGEAGLKPTEIRAISSHGQTIWHEPGHSTWQLGDAARIAERTQCDVISDFRSRDVAAGGQGAPLVPIADLLLFSHPSEWRALQNIGGIGNVTLVPPAGEETLAESVKAFDTGPGVVVIDGVAKRLFGQPFDRDGLLAQRGRIHFEVITAMLDLPYFLDPPPKSTGRELFSPSFIDEFISRCSAHGATPEDTLATACGFTAMSIADQYGRWLKTAPHDLVVSGGGAKNPYLLGCIRGAFDGSLNKSRRYPHPMPGVKQFDELFFDAEAKEAVAFALLGYLHLRGRAGNVPAATGAGAPRILGVLSPASRI